MAQVTYENEVAVLKFQYQDVMDTLSQHIEEHSVESDWRLLTWLQTQSKSGSKDISINEQDEYEGSEYVKRIVYVIKGLLSDAKGDVFCKPCNRDILASEIKKQKISPFDYYKGVDKKTIKRVKKEFGLKGRVRLPGSGGTTFFCDKGHELFATRNWIV